MARPKESEREDIRALVLTKAKKLFLELGYRNITIRKIAGEIGYTPATIYLYFKNKDEILYELHNEGFKLLYQYKMKMAAENPETAVERLHRGGRMYIDFALENPEYYELMFNMPEPRDFMQDQLSGAGPDRGMVDYAMRSYDFLKEGVRQLMDEGYLQGIDPDTATFSFWATVHGIVTLIIRKRIPYPQAPGRDLAYASIDFFMQRFQAMGGQNKGSD